VSVLSRSVTMLAASAPLLMSTMGTSKAACANAAQICVFIGDCLNGSVPGEANDRNRINDGLSHDNGNTIFAGVSACQTNRQHVPQWNLASVGCTDVEYLALARKAQSSGADYAIACKQ
jgi:hypothetical protein